VAVDRCAGRREKLVSILHEEELDGLIVTRLPNIRYLTGFSGSAAILVVSRMATAVFTDSRYRTQIFQEVGKSVSVEVAGDMWRRVWDMLGAVSDRSCYGYEGHSVTVSKANGFPSGDTGFTIRPVESLVERLRVRKDPEEVRAIGHAARLATEALDRVLENVRVGMTELEIAGLLERELRIGGSEWHPFPTIVASGPRSALPHAVTSTREIQTGEWLLLDFGAQVDGYCADVSRTVLVGRTADERQRDVYELVREAQQLACRGVRAGMTGREADMLARSRIEAGGMGEAFVHSLGHGLGLEVHEEPRLSKQNEVALPAGCVITIEPGVYLPDWGGVRIEDDVFLSEDGPILLSDGNTELRELT